MSPAQPEGEKPVEKEIRADCQKTHHHWRVAFADRVERGRQHFQRRIRNEPDRIKSQRARSLLRRLRVEVPVLVNHANDWRRQHCQPNGRGNRKQKRQPHSARKNRAELSRVPQRGALRNQWQRHCPDGHSKNSQRQLHQAKRNVEPAHRPVAETRCKSAIDQHIHLHRARGDHRRSHQGQHCPHTFVAPVKIGVKLVADMMQ